MSVDEIQLLRTRFSGVKSLSAGVYAHTDTTSARYRQDRGPAWREGQQAGRRAFHVASREDIEACMRLVQEKHQLALHHRFSFLANGQAKA